MQHPTLPCLLVSQGWHCVRPSYDFQAVKQLQIYLQICEPDTPRTGGLKSNQSKSETNEKSNTWIAKRICKVHCDIKNKNKTKQVLISFAPASLFRLAYINKGKKASRGREKKTQWREEENKNHGQQQRNVTKFWNLKQFTLSATCHFALSSARIRFSRSRID